MTWFPESVNRFLRQFDDKALQACVCLYVFSIPLQVNIIGTSHTASYYIAIVLTLMYVASFFSKPRKYLFTFWPLLISVTIFFIDIGINKSALFDSNRIHIQSSLNLLILCILITTIRYGKDNFIAALGISYILAQIITCLIFISRPQLEYFDYYYRTLPAGYLEIVIDNSFSVFKRSPNDVAYGFLCAIGLSIYLLAHNLKKNRPIRCCSLFFTILLMSYGITYTANRGSLLGVFVLFLVLSVYFYFKGTHIKSMLLIFLSSSIMMYGVTLYESETVPSYSTLKGKLFDVGRSESVEINQVDHKINDRQPKNTDVKASIEILVKNYNHRKFPNKARDLAKLTSAREPLKTLESERVLRTREPLKTLESERVLRTREPLKTLESERALRTREPLKTLESERVLRTREPLKTLESERVLRTREPLKTLESERVLRTREPLKTLEYPLLPLKIYKLESTTREQAEKSLKNLNKLKYLTTYGFSGSYCSNRVMNIFSLNIVSWYSAQKNIPCLKIIDPKRAYIEDLRDKGIKHLKMFITLQIIEEDGNYKYLKNDGTYFTVDIQDDSWMNLGGRLSSWKVAYELLKENIFFGIGSDNFQIIATFLTHAQSPHNLFIHVCILSGITGLFLLLTPFMLALFKLKKFGVWSLNSNMMFVILCFGPIVGLAAMTLNVYTIKDWWLFLAFIIGLWIQNAEKKRKILN